MMSYSLCASATLASSAVQALPLAWQVSNASHSGVSSSEVSGPVLAANPGENLEPRKPSILLFLSGQDGGNCCASNYERFVFRDQKVVKRADGGVIYVTASGACGGYEKFPHPGPLWFIAKKWRGAPFLGLCTVNDRQASIEFVTTEGVLIDVLALEDPQAVLRSYRP